MDPFKTYVIQHKETKKLWQADSGKTRWGAAGHAKAAWKRSVVGVPKHLGEFKGKHLSRFEPFRFDDQNEFEIVEMKTHNPLKGRKYNVQKLFDHYRNERYNSHSEHFRFEHFWNELCKLMED